MAQEIELKYLDVDLPRLRRDLELLGAARGERRFERNMVFDTPGRALLGQGMLLRLRRDGRVLLTFKRPPERADCAAEDALPRDVKIVEEIETEVEDFEAMRRILEGLGYVPAFCYEKVRETWRLGEVEICLDKLPFGDFVELEGGRENILACAERLGLTGARASTATYHALCREHRESCGLPADENFVFTAEPPLAERHWRDESGT